MRARSSNAITAPAARELTEARLRMARTPEGAELIPNRMSGAPGIRARLFDLFVMADVAAHHPQAYRPALTGALEGEGAARRAHDWPWAPESEVADLLRAGEKDHPGVAIGALPSFATAASAPISSFARPTRNGSSLALPPCARRSGSGLYGDRRRHLIGRVGVARRVTRDDGAASRSRTVRTAPPPEGGAGEMYRRVQRRRPGHGADEQQGRDDLSQPHRHCRNPAPRPARQHRTGAARHRRIALGDDSCTGAWNDQQEERPRIILDRA